MLVSLIVIKLPPFESELVLPSAKVKNTLSASKTVSGADAYEVWGAELKGIDDAGLTEKQKQAYIDKGLENEEFAITSFRTIIPVVAE